jgi:hypothetical protein
VVGSLRHQKTLHRCQLKVSPHFSNPNWLVWDYEHVAGASDQGDNTHDYLSIPLCICGVRLMAILRIASDHCGVPGVIPNLDIGKHVPPVFHAKSSHSSGISIPHVGCLSGRFVDNQAGLISKRVYGSMNK